MSVRVSKNLLAQTLQSLLHEAAGDPTPESYKIVSYEDKIAVVKWSDGRMQKWKVPNALSGSAEGAKLLSKNAQDPSPGEQWTPFNAKQKVQLDQEIQKLGGIKKVRPDLYPQQEAQGTTSAAAPAADTSSDTAGGGSGSEQRAEFKALVDKLKKKGYQRHTAGDKRFTKQFDQWFVAGEGLTNKELLALVKPESRDKIEALLTAADKKPANDPNAGVTIRGEDFISPTRVGATFRRAGQRGYWEDRTPIPVEILAQYTFESEGKTGEAFQADLVGDQIGEEKPLVYRQDKVMVVLYSDNLYILSQAGNQDDPLGATKALLSGLDLEPRVQGARFGSTIGGKGAESVLNQQRESLKRFLDPAGAGDEIPVPIRSFKFGDIQKAISKTRTTAAKFFQLFSQDTIRMSFMMSPWGPCMIRAAVFGGRGIDVGAGDTVGMLSPKDVEVLKQTGLFIDEDLPTAGPGTYTVDLNKPLAQWPLPRTESRSRLHSLILNEATPGPTPSRSPGDPPVRQDIASDVGVSAPAAAPAATAASPAAPPPPAAAQAPKITVTPVSYGPSTGDAEVANVDEYAVKYAKADANGSKPTYDNTYADAYFLYSNGAMSADVTATPEDEFEAPAEETAAAKEAIDPLIEICAKELGQAVAKGAAFFKFNKTDYVTPPEIPDYSADAYVDAVVSNLRAAWTSILNKFYTKENPIPLTVIGTADQIGKDQYNDTLSDSRCDTLIASIKAKLGEDVPVAFTKIPTGETFWAGSADTERNEVRVYKRYAKVYWCKLTAESAARTTFEYTKEAVAAVIGAPAGGEATAAAPGEGAPAAGGPAKKSPPPPKINEEDAKTWMTANDKAYFMDDKWSYQVVDETVKIWEGPRKIPKDSPVVWSMTSTPGVGGNQSENFRRLIDTLKARADGKLPDNKTAYFNWVSGPRADDPDDFLYKYTPGKIFAFRKKDSSGFKPGIGDYTKLADSYWPDDGTSDWFDFFKSKILSREITTYETYEKFQTANPNYPKTTELDSLKESHQDVRRAIREILRRASR